MRRAVTLAAVALATVAAAPADAATRLSIRGAGFGHGVGMSQYGAYGYAQQGRTYREILRHYYRGTGLAVLSDRPEVRVLLQGGRRTVTFSGVVRAGGRLLDPAKTYSARAGGQGVVLRSPAGRSLLTSPAPMRLEAPRDGSLLLAGTSEPGVRDGRYRGALELRAAGSGSDGLNVINAVGLEDYVRGVVSAESPPTWPADALKAQAVAARTYAITTSKAGAGFDQYADTRSQVYRGVSAELPATDAAVAATRYQVVTYGGRPVVTYFFSTSGGHTENVENSFVGSTPQPWLKGVDDPYDDVSPRHRWGPLRFTAAQVQRRLGRLVAGTFRRIRVVQRGASPRIVRAQVVGSRGTTNVTGAQLRKAFGLNDTWAYFRTISSSTRRGGSRSGDPLPGDPSTGGTTTDGLRALAVLAAAVRARTPHVSGTIAPARTGSIVRLERLTGGRWETAAEGRILAGGRYELPAPQPGEYRVRFGEDAGPGVRVG
jgi:stage II sporulation protein D